MEEAASPSCCCPQSGVGHPAYNESPLATGFLPVSETVCVAAGASSNPGDQAPLDQQSLPLALCPQGAPCSRALSALTPGRDELSITQTPSGLETWEEEMA